MASTKKIFIIGGTGAQGIPVVRDLAADPQYSLRILTRDASGPRAQELLALAPDRIELQEGTLESDAGLRRGFRGCWGAFVNIDGFIVGEKAEVFWAMRTYEVAVECGLQSFVYGNLDYGYKKGGYDPQFYAAHYDGKGRVGEWILDQHKRNKSGSLAGYDMKVSLFTTGPYLDMAISSSGPMVPKVEKDENGDEVLTWRVPLTADGGIPHIALDDCGYYVKWLIENPGEADGLDLEVSIEHVHYADLAKAFGRVTGHKARFIDTDWATYWREGSLSQIKDAALGVHADLDDPATLTVQQNFTGWWSIWRASGYNRGVVRRDYAQLDRIFPGRVRTAEEFLRRQDEQLREQGSSLWEKMVDNKPILKLHEDGKAR
ncbi:hypothetical protein INS49_004615 [Diaporthe citri]|uniref:uncharacterized protein n=1 Tax=Diaporthe citri TaxID=83186 RepID=UPI001C80F319|nr:uncharacterized protein INS49_004615 [Diaporthe citri]KAG6354597.1 hypothetical protein INS49_004615 [Diaporthe citri]